ncbi:glycoside hydrolase family 3 N-terminal domain-containing protein [Dietzia sp.]|uniref:glycoside hydrolase family 3 N-terminal domain-containing protein n=1 Tax=Dietzia sp. TaxID=1871616 RepID=UPI002FDB3F1F
MNFRTRLRAAPLCVVLAVASGCSSLTAPTSEPTVAQPTVSAASSTTEPPTTSNSNCAVTTELDSMEVRTKIAQLLTVGVSSPEDAAWAVNDFHVGGIFIGSEVAESVLSAGILPQLRRQAPFPTTVTIDEEGGRVTRMDQVSGPLPSARQMASMPIDDVRNLARARGEEMNRLGITVDFAPTVDVTDRPDDDVIGDRSFSPDPQVVTDYARAFAEGLLQAGITPVFKHFPGHGRGSGDSHTGSVTVPPLPDLAGYELRPFAQLAGMPGTAVMMGHLEIPGVTAPGEPASLSPAAYQLLRSGAEYGGQPYDGVIYTDDLSGMRAITDNHSIPDAVLLSLIAGADAPLWISTNDLDATISTIEAAVADGRYPVERLDESVRRITELRASNSCGE